MPTLSLSLFAAIRENVKRFASQPCLRYKSDGRWQVMSWTEMWQRVSLWSRGLIDLGLVPGDRVAILAPTRLEWTLADLAILAAGGIVVPIYHSLTALQVGEIAADAQPRFAFVDGEREVVTLAAAGVASCIAFAPTVGSLSLHELEERGTRVPPSLLEERLHGLTPDQSATYVYTSGTTGRQKGVIITHANIMAEIEATLTVLTFARDDIGLLVLPLPHVLGRMIQFFQLVAGCQTAFAEGFEELAANYLEVRPHFMIGVPRMLEKIYARIAANVSALPTWKQRLFHWGVDVAGECQELVRRHRPLPLGLRFRFALARRLVLHPLRARLGGRLRVFISGGAPLGKEIARFFTACGLLVLEGYGLTETFAAVTVNRPDDYCFGTVGKPLPGVSLKIAPDGELLVKGPMVFRAYHHLPEETAAAFDDEGWFQTGDIAEYSKEGFVRITDRKKDLIVTSGGKKIAPQPIEGLLTQSRCIEQAMLYGDRRKFCVALIVPNRGEVAVALRQKGGASDIHRLIEAEIAAGNRQLAHFETIKRFAIIDEPFTVENGLLTPTLKVKRRAVEEKYQALLEGLYHEEE